MEKSQKKKKSVLSRVLKWTGISFLTIIIILILIPVFFKDKIKELALQEANKMLLAKVDVNDFDLTIIKTFPYMTARFDGVSITGKNDFEGVKLVDIERFDARVNFWSVIKGDQIEIESITLKKPTIDVRVLKSGKANYDIVKPDSLKTEEELEEPSSFKLSLKKYAIENADISYDDKAGGMKAVLKNMTHTGKGDLTADVIDFKTKTNMDELSFTMDGLSYLNKVKTDLIANLLMEFTEKSSKFTLQENSLQLNALQLSVDGFYEMLEGKDNMDLTLNTSKATFKDLLSLIPAFYKTGYESMVTKGSMALNAHVKGIMDEKNMPGWNAGLKITDASIRYPDLPQSINNIQVDAKSSFAGGSNLNKMTADVDKFHADFAGNILDAILKVRNIIEDPLIDTKIVAKVNLASLGQVVPMPAGQSYSGKLDADIALKGKMSSIEKERYEDFKAEGTLRLKDMLYKSPDIPEEVTVNTMLFRFSPKNLALEELDGKMGKSDFKVKGTIDNYLGYIFREELLKGNFDFFSNNLDIDQLMGTVPSSPTEAGSAPQPESTTSSDPVKIPSNIDFNLNTRINSANYNGIKIQNLKGAVGLKNETAYLNDLTLNAMGGAVGLKGSFNTQGDKPKVNFAYVLKELDINELATNFITIDKLAPIAKYAQGKVSSNFSMNTLLTSNLEPVFSSLTAGGDFSTLAVHIAGFEPMNKVASALKMEKLNNQTIKNLKAKFQVTEGKVFVNPFDVKLGNITTNVAGFTTLEQDLDYTLKMNVPKEEIPANIIKGIEDGLKKINGLSPVIKLNDLPAFIPVNVKVMGKVTSPKITTDLENQIKSLTGNLSKAAIDAGKEVVEKAKDSVKTIVNNKVTEVKEDLNKKKQEILDEGQKQADKAKAEGKKAADKIRKEADEAYVKAVEAAGSNPLKKKLAETAAQKGKDEAYKKADQVEAEANKQADNIMNTARQKADAVK